MKSTAQDTSALPTQPQSDKPPATGNPRRVRVLIVDDHPLMRWGIRGILQQHPGYEVCAEADSAPQALELARAHRPDLAIVDIGLGSVNGIDLLKDLLAEHRGLRALVMSMHEESLYAERALRAGARGYVMKLEAGEQMMAAIERVLGGGIYLSRQMSERLPQYGEDLAGPKQPAAPIETLSDREVEVLQLVGDGYDTQAIANRLQLSVRDINSHREHLKRKLGFSFGAELVHYAIQLTRSAPAG